MSTVSGGAYKPLSTAAVATPITALIAFAPESSRGA
jgi:hypothetical protein